jgi:hypothetical protein
MVYHVSEEALDWALSHSENFGDTDVLPTPFEFKALRHCWSTIKPNLLNQDLDTRQVKEHRRFIAPKGPYAYRVVTQIDPVDFLFFSALVYEIGQDIENHRTATTEEIVHSSRFNPENDGRMFGRDYSYASFMQKCREMVALDSSNYIVVADIADFYPRIYLHRIETALSTATTQNGASRAIIKFLKGWQDRVSYGIPVGSASARLLAEITINDIDEYLISDDYNYCRYSDDFRIFCNSKKEAYSKLETLATVLFENHGLFLQPGKTKILKKEQFISQYLQSHLSNELNSLRERFGNIVDRLGIENPYETLDYEDLPEEIQSEIDGLNLVNMLKEQLQTNEIDVSMFKFLLKRLGQLNQAVVLGIFRNMDKCYHLVPSVVSYLKILKANGSSLERYTDKIIDLLSNSQTCQLPFNRLWWLSLSSDNNLSIPERDLMRIYRVDTDPAVKRKVILSLGRAHHASWFRREKNGAMNLDPWSKRAFIAAASCMANDECNTWYDTIRRRQDEMGQAIITWAKDNPFITN